MYRSIKDFVNDWTYESESTLKLFAELTEQSLNEKPHNDVRSIGRLAWHITLTIAEMMNRTGLKVVGPAEDAPVPNSAKEIYDTYKSCSDSLIDLIQKQWADESLFLEDDMYGEMWAKGKTLGVLVTHQIHHRGQLTVLMRQAGLKVIGIYGPAKEEWSNYGMPAAE